MVIPQIVFPVGLKYQNKHCLTTASSCLTVCNQGDTYHLRWAGTAHCTDLCYGTQTMNSSRVCSCLLSVRAATMATYAWTKLHTQIMSCISAMVCAWSLPEATSATVHTVWGLMSVGRLPQSLSVMANPTLLSSLSFSVHCLLHPPSDHGRLRHVITTIFVHDYRPTEKRLETPQIYPGIDVTTWN